MDLINTKVFIYKRINAVFELKFKTAIVKHEHVDSIAISEEEKKQLKKTINVKANYYEVSNLFKKSV